MQDDVLVALRTELPEAARRALAAIVDEVDEYRTTLTPEVAATIEQAIGMALAGLLRRVAAGVDPDAATPEDVAIRGAYALGRGEARQERSANALLAAYRIGARVSWRHLSAVVVAHRVAADEVADLAAIVFAYIDGLSAASVAGHASELASAGRARQAARQRLVTALVEGRAVALTALAEQAGWPLPERVVVAVVASSAALPLASALPDGALQVDGPTVGVGEDVDVIVAPADDAMARDVLLRVLDGHGGAVGPVRPLDRTAGSLALAARGWRAFGGGGSPTVDTLQHLPRLLVGADPEVHDDLSDRVLQPFADLDPETRARLATTLRAWLLHLGRRNDVAEALHVHPQTVRYRMRQVEELFGDALLDPTFVEAATIALVMEPDASN